MFPPLSFFWNEVWILIEVNCSTQFTNPKKREKIVILGHRKPCATVWPTSPSLLNDSWACAPNGQGLINLNIYIIKLIKHKFKHDHPHCRQATGQARCLFSNVAPFLTVLPVGLTRQQVNNFSPALPTVRPLSTITWIELRKSLIAKRLLMSFLCNNKKE